MQLNKHTAVIDNDFTDHLAGCHLSNERLIEVLKLVFTELGLSAVMHPLVYQYELLIDKDRIKLLFEHNIISKAEFSDMFLGNNGRKQYYIDLIEDLYELLTGNKPPISGENILTSWVRGKSLGEVHSVAMCLLCGCGIFLSDDGDSKQLKSILDKKTIGTIDVYSREDFINKHMSEGETKLNRKERKSLTHVLT